MYTNIIAVAFLLATGCCAQNETATLSSAPTTVAPAEDGADVCMCVQKDECKDDTVETKDTKATKVAQDTGCSPEQVCCYHLIVRTEKTVETHSYYYRNGKTTEDDGVARAGEFPWQALLFSQDEEFLCSGVIVSPKHVLTTADCAHPYQGDQASKLGVRLGVLDRSVAEDSPIHQNYTVDKVIVHPKFRSSHIRNIAVVKLGQEVGTTPTIGRVALARPENNFVGKRSCLVSGWGKNLKRGSLSTQLRKANVTVLQRAACQTQLQKTRLGPSFKLDEGSMCAADENGAAACEADEGGPLICKKNGEPRYVLVGVVSYGDLFCGKMGMPTVYADVARNIDFISEASGLPKERFWKH